jgi:hypothetical protein
MSLIFDKLLQHASEFQTILNTLDRSDEVHDFPWDNLVYTSKYIRRAHLDIVDKREDRKLLMMHLCVFPHVDSDAPIYGFDLIAGPNKVTGAFHDFSPCSTDGSVHPLSELFTKEVTNHSWSKQRELPDWAKKIFSPWMVAAGNIRDINELSEILELSKNNLISYIEWMKLNYVPNNKDYTQQQNNYCYNQKQNPHTPRVMESLGYEPGTVHRFIQTCLFPEIMQ